MNSAPEVVNPIAGFEPLLQAQPRLPAELGHRRNIQSRLEALADAKPVLLKSVSNFPLGHKIDVAGFEHCLAVYLAHEVNHAGHKRDLASEFHQAVTLRRRNDEDALGYD